MVDYHVTGTIVDKESGRPIVGLSVRGYDKDFLRDQLLGDGHTDENGRYEIAFNRDDFTGPLIRLERQPDIAHSEKIAKFDPLSTNSLEAHSECWRPPAQTEFTTRTG
jgi:hypothetical protein